ncbi:hypothetical protein PMAYCL1PPCAC_19038, partial [Pristionchus mayeri]
MLLSEVTDLKLLKSHLIFIRIVPSGLSSSNRGRASSVQTQPSLTRASSIRFIVAVYLKVYILLI